MHSLCLSLRDNLHLSVICLCIPRTTLYNPVSLCNSLNVSNSQFSSVSFFFLSLYNSLYPSFSLYMSLLSPSISLYSSVSLCIPLWLSANLSWDISPTLMFLHHYDLFAILFHTQIIRISFVLRNNVGSRATFFHFRLHRSRCKIVANTTKYKTKVQMYCNPQSAIPPSGNPPLRARASIT